MDSPTIAALILAAGAASRFGSCKALTKVDGCSLLQQRIDALMPLCPGNLHVVTGAWGQAIEAAFAAGHCRGARRIYNPDWRRGIGHSLATGVRALAPQVDGILVVLADQIALGTAELQPLLDRFDGEHSVCAHYAGRRGVPALFARRHFSALMALDGDRGAKALLQHADDMIDYPLAAAAWDIDTRHDLLLWQQALAHA